MFAAHPLIIRKNLQRKSYIVEITQQSIVIIGGNLTNYFTPAQVTESMYRVYYVAIKQSLLYLTATLYFRNKHVT